MIVYFNSDFAPKAKVTISPDDRGFLFGDGVYEVLRFYGGRLFRAEEHFRRLARSLQEIRIDGLDVGSLREIAHELLERNGLQDNDGKLYLQVTRGVAPRRHSFPDDPVTPTVYVEASPFRPSREKWEVGVRIVLVDDLRWGRCDIKSVALLPNVLASQQAKESGAEEAIFVHTGVVTEGAHTNFCAVFDGELVTHPLGDRILAGVTRGAVLDLCRQLRIPVREAPVRVAKLRQASELMIVGTTTEIMPVIRVDDWRVGNGKPGPVTRDLQRAFRNLVAAR